MYKMSFRHVVYAAYVAHRQKDRTGYSEHGGARRLYPSFKTTGGQIIPPEDVSETAVPIFDVNNQIWAGREVTQLKRDDPRYYTGRFDVGVLELTNIIFRGS